MRSTHGRPAHRPPTAPATSDLIDSMTKVGRIRRSHIQQRHRGSMHMSTPAGWYDDGSGRQRWWDGTQWTDHFADAAQAGGGEVAQSAAGSPGATLTAAPPAAAFAAPAAATAVAAPKTKPSAVGIIALVVSAI